MKQPIWDLPVRLFHWTLAGLIGFSWWSAKNDHQDWHIWSGLAVLTLLIFRSLWGVFGSSTARFSSFVPGPASISNYLSGNWRGIGHTPLGGLSVVAMLAAIAVQVGLGLFSSDEDGLYVGPLANFVSIHLSEELADLHEDFFNVLLAVIVLHVAAIVYYRLRGKHLIMPMITGRGKADPGIEPLRHGKWWVAFICLAAGLGITRWLIAGAPPFSS